MKDESAEEVALIDAIHRGGSDARRAEQVLLERYGARVRRFAQHHLRDGQLAADLVHDVFLVVIDAARSGRIEQPDRLGGFVLATCRHLVWDENRADGRRRRPVVELEPGVVELPAFTELDVRRLELCMMGLGEREKGVVILTYVEEWSADRIAAAFGTSTGNVRVIRHRALANLHACMEGGA